MTAETRFSKASIAAIVGAGLCFLGPAAILCPVPIIFGHIAQRNIRADCSLKGAGLSLASMIIGYFFLALLFAFVIWILAHPGNPWA